MNDKPVVIHSRLEAHIHAALQDYARKTHRSVNGAVNFIVEQYLIAEDTKKVAVEEVTW